MKINNVSCRRRNKKFKICLHLISFVCGDTSSAIFELSWLLYSQHVCKCKNAMKFRKTAGKFRNRAISKSERGSADEMRRKLVKEKRETRRARGRKEWSRRSRGDIRLRGQGLCLRVISCKNPINFLNPPPVAKGVANKRAYENEREGGPWRARKCRQFG